MKVLVVGGGGREHAVVKKLRESPGLTRLYCAPGNGGISQDAECVSIAATDVRSMVDFAQQEAVDLVVVTPDDPLMLGMADALTRAGIRAFGPRQNAALIEGSKVFSKGLMKKYGIPTAEYEVFGDPAAALDFIRRRGKYPAVVKADGLALGKGVFIAQDEAEAQEALHALMEDRIFGASGNRVVVEECLTGPEVSVLAFTDAKTLRPMVSSMDHKRAFDGDQGPNTGGMGTVAPNPFYTPEIARRCMEEIFLPTVDAMNREGRPFRGCLYFGLMLTENGPKVIEYNARFGDPETQVVLPLLDGDLLEIFTAVAESRLSEVSFGIKPGAAACVVAASGGYPVQYEKGREITGLDEAAAMEGVQLFHAGTALENGRFYTAGGRVLGVTAVAATLPDALRRSYDAMGKIHFEGIHYRRDIGRAAPGGTTGSRPA